MRWLIRTFFIVAILAAIYLIYSSYFDDQSRTIVAAIALIVAISSAWSTYENFYNQLLAKQAQLVLEFDLESRYKIIQLVIKNYGSKPAFKIKIDWDNVLTGSNKKHIISFNKTGSKDYDIPVLNKDEKISLLVDRDKAMFDNFEIGKLTFTGDVTYQNVWEGWRPKRQTTKFSISLEQYRNATDNSSEAIKAFHDIPMQLEGIKDELKKINNKINKSDA
jgi:hypothetical protein